MTAAIPLRANADLISVSWLKLAVPGVGVATTLPKVSDTPALRTDGFIRVLTVGGSPDLDNPWRQPVVTAECWAAPAVEGSDKPPWGRANSLAEAVIAACYDRALMDRVLDLGAYPDVRVRTVVALSEPRRVENDPGNWARYDVDLLLTWSTQ